MCLLPGFSSGVMVVAPLCSRPPLRKVIPVHVTIASLSQLFGYLSSLSLPQRKCTGAVVFNGIHPTQGSHHTDLKLKMA
ncbi:hypothetical protein BDZ89DRAFT_145549 [Hymenopellis radicata]|nr:hypothetical protein BDZ89DRAFT_145549 [Hymenopellis radicata]